MDMLSPLLRSHSINECAGVSESTSPGALLVSRVGFPIPSFETDELARRVHTERLSELSKKEFVFCRARAYIYIYIYHILYGVHRSVRDA